MCGTVVLTGVPRTAPRSAAVFQIYTKNGPAGVKMSSTERQSTERSDRCQVGSQCDSGVTSYLSWPGVSLLSGHWTASACCQVTGRRQRAVRSLDLLPGHWTCCQVTGPAVRSLDSVSVLSDHWTCCQVTGRCQSAIRSLDSVSVLSGHWTSACCQVTGTQCRPAGY